MKVAYITVQFPVPSETFATNEVRTLSECGVTVAVFGLRPAHADAADLRLARGVPDIHTEHNGVWASARGIVSALARPRLLLRTMAWIIRSTRRDRRDLLISFLLLPRAFDILRSIVRLRPDVVHMFWGHYPTLVGYLVQQHVPSVVTSMSIIAYDLEREYGGAVEVAANADVIRTHALVNRAHVARFTGLAPDRVHVIFDGIDIAWIERIAAGIEKVPRRIVATGRLIEEKGMDDVLTAFAAVHRRWPDATLVVAGDGPDRERLREITEVLDIANAVQFIGHVAHERVVEEMARAEVFLLLSRYGGDRLPNVVKEGMASRCVCITTATVGIEELVDTGVTGFVVPLSAPEAASELVDALFAGRLNASVIMEAGADYVRRNFDLRRTAPRYLELWRAAVEMRRRARESARDEAVGREETKASHDL